MNEINLDDAKIMINGEWLSTEDLARRIEERMQAGDMKISHLATALEALNQAIENSHTIEVKIAISKQDYEKLRALGGADDREAVRKATLSFIKGEQPTEPFPEPSPPEKIPDAPVEEPEDAPAETPDADVEAPAAEPEDLPVVNCLKCGSPIEITTDERPVDITCPKCGTTGRLKSNNEIEPRHKDSFLG
jgi:hypothetical protein